MKVRFIAASMAALALAGCGPVNNAITGIFGGSGFARLVDASPGTTQSNIALQADHGTINSGISAAMPIGPYTKVNAGNVAFDINTGAGTTDIVPAISVNVAGSTNYSIVLEGEPGSADYTAVSFQDTNALNNPATVRFKVDNAAPNLTTPVDVFVWQSGTAIPGVATVPALALNQDSGSVATHPGNSYIPQQGSSTTLPSGTYNIAVVPTGSAPNGSSDLFDGSVAMSVNNSYSLILEDASASQNSIRVLQAIDEPFQTSNQTSISRHRI